MLEVLNWVGQHPYLSVVLILSIGTSGQMLAHGLSNRAVKVEPIEIKPVIKRE